VFYQQTRPWNGAESGENYLMRLTASGGLPDGTYRMQLFVNGLLFGEAEARVGIGQLPIDRFAQAGGVQLRGQVLDAETRQGIPGASFIVISEDFSAAEFMEAWSETQVYASAVTDRNGRFQVERLLQPNVPYSVVVYAEGYLPILADDIEVTSSPSVVDAPVYLTRD